MLTAALKKRHDFTRMRHSPYRFVSSHLVVQIADNDSLLGGGGLRVGYVVSRKCGKAVSRNRIKRRLRHAADILPLDWAVDLVIIARAEAAKCSFDALRRDLSETLQNYYDAVNKQKGKRNLA